MASTAAIVFFCRPGSISLRALLTGFLVVCAEVVCAGVVCASADAASNSKDGITKVLFILSSFFVNRFEKQDSAIPRSAPEGDERNRSLELPWYQQAVTFLYICKNHLFAGSSS